MITIEQVKALREATGVSIMQCRKALEEAAGDFDKAILILRRKGADAASKKGDRVFGAGVVASYIHGTGGIGSMVELVCETDFVSRNPEFKELAHNIAMHVVAARPQYLKTEDLDSEEKIKLTELFTEEVKDKPENLREKIIAGKIEAFVKERALMVQPYVKDPELTVADLINNFVQKFGERIEVSRFVVYKLLEK